MWKPVTGGGQENTANQGKVVKRFKALPSSTVRVSCDLAFLLFWIRIMISLININCLLKGQFLFAEILLCLQPLKNNQPPIVFMPKTHILGWHILLPITHMGLGWRFFCVQGGDWKKTGLEIIKEQQHWTLVARGKARLSLFSPLPSGRQTSVD